MHINIYRKSKPSEENLPQQSSTLTDLYQSYKEKQQRVQKVSPNVIVSLNGKFNQIFLSS